MNVVSLVYDELDSQVQGQIIRDLLALSKQRPLVNTDDPELLPILNALHVQTTTTKPSLVVLYRVKKWLAAPRGVTLIKRDLKPRRLDFKIDGNPHVGYYLREQGRPGANLTERYLTRTAPAGKGIVDPLLIQTWG
jgi:hypothetical protein